MPLMLLSEYWIESESIVGDILVGLVLLEGKKERKGTLNNKSIGKNYLYNMAYQVLVMILPLVTTPYISRVLGAANIGSYSYTQSIVYYFTLFGTLGLNLYGQREIAYVQDDTEKRSKVFWEVLFIRIITHAFSLAVFCTTFVHHTKYGLLFTIQIIDIIASCIDVSWFFQGMEDFKRLTIRNILIKLCAVICIFGFVKVPNDIYKYAICYSASLILGNAVMLVYLPRLIEKIRIRELNFKKHIKPCIILFLPQIATSLYNVLDKTMIGMLTQIEEEVAYYEQAQKIVKVALSFLTSIGTVMLPRIAFVFSKKDFSAIESYMQKSFRYAFLLGIPLTLGMIAAASHLVPWFYGPGYEKVIPNIMIIAPIILIVGLSNVIGVQYLLPTGRQRDYFISVITGAVANVALNAVLIPRLFSVGAALGSVFAEFVVLLAQMILTKKDIKYFKVIKTSVKYWFAGIVMFIAVSFPFINCADSIITSLMQIVVGCGSYFVILVLLREEIIVDIIDKLRRKKNV